MTVDGKVSSAIPDELVTPAESDSSQSVQGTTKRGHSRRYLAGGLRRLGWWVSTTTWGSARWQRALFALVGGVILWPQSSVEAGVGLDPSWQAGLAMARLQDIPWGRELVFTYGPLGFLRTDAYYAFDQALLAAIYQVAILLALLLGIAAVLRLRRPPMVALICAFITTSILSVMSVGHGLAFMPSSALEMMYPELVVLAAFAWASVQLLKEEPNRSAVITTCVIIGGAAGFQLLVKFNTGLAVLAIGVCLSVLMDWKFIGRHCATVGAFVASTFICWLLAGQQPWDLSSWLQLSAEIASGYVEGMSTSPLPRWGISSVILSVGWVVAVCTLFLRRHYMIPRRYLALVGLVTVFAGKAAFGRFETWHFAILLSLIVIALVITPWQRATLPAVVLAAITVATVWAVNLGGATIVQDRAALALQSPLGAIDRVATLARPDDLRKRTEEAKARQRALYAVPDRFLNTIGSGSVHVDPQEISVAWAYNLKWRPAIVFQTYQALTPILDERNGDSLRDGPQFVLSRLSPAAPAVGLDGRLGVQESPRYSRALLCNFSLSGIEDRWALFRRTSPRCGPLTKISEVTATENEAIQVPRPSSPEMAVLMSIDLNRNPHDEIFHGKLLPLGTFTVVVDGVTYRLIDRNAGQPFLINTPASVAGTNLEIKARAVEVGRTVDVYQPPTTARIRFYEMRVGA